MNRISKPSRKAIKQAIRNVARLTGITIRQARPLTRDKAFLRNTDHFIKAKRCYPVSVGGTPTTVDTDKPFEVTFEFRMNGKRIEPQPSPLVPIPKPMARMTPEKMSELMLSLRELVKKSPVTFITSTPGRRNDNFPSDDVIFFTGTDGHQAQDQQLVVHKPRQNTDPTFTFETPPSWKILDDRWSELLSDKKFLNEKPKDA